MTIDQHGITWPRGFKAAAIHSGLRRREDWPDVVLIASDRPATWAATYTTNRIQAAPLRLTHDHVERHLHGRAVAINVAYANAATGQQGERDARETAELVGRLLDAPPEEVAVASTGVIGEPIPMDTLRDGLTRCAAALETGDEIDRRAALGILTTDTRPKTASTEIEVDGHAIRIAGMAKGSGMIAPNMATMLAFITTDADVERRTLVDMLRMAAHKSFNTITVDGHTSTNDMVLAMASGAAGNTRILRGRRGLAELTAGLEAVCQSLAEQIVADGEGAGRVMEIVVTGAPTPEQARQAAFAIANSPLVKCAVHGGDPNWGRILSAAGYSGAELDESKTAVSIGGVTVFAEGGPLKENREAAAEKLLQPRVTIGLDLGLGTGRFTALGCDLSKDYITINAEYHT
jgi:glutamate N-acetyltransferase/amino-acid N-acetyltransferase